MSDDERAIREVIATWLCASAGRSHRLEATSDVREVRVNEGRWVLARDANLLTAEP